jgi:hypothetical protein
VRLDQRRPGLVSFEFATFLGGTVNFDEASFSGGSVSFDYAEFSGGQVHFIGAEFPGGTVGFDRATFSGGEVSFTGVGRRMPAPTRTRSGPMTSPPTNKAASRAGAMAPEATTTGLVD